MLEGKFGVDALVPRLCKRISAGIPQEILERRRRGLITYFSGEALESGMQKKFRH